MHRCLAALALVATASLLGAAPAPAATEPTVAVPDRCEGTDARVAPVALPTALLASGAMVPLRDRTGAATFDPNAPASAMGTPLCAVQQAGDQLVYHWLYCNDFDKNSCANDGLLRVANDASVDPARVAYALSLVDNSTHESRASSQRLVWCATEGRASLAVPPPYLGPWDDPDLRCPDWSKAVPPTLDVTPPATAAIAGSTARVTLTTNRRTVAVDASGAQLSVCPDSAATATLAAGRLTFASATGGTAVLCAAATATGATSGTVTASLPGGIVTWRRPGGVCQGLMELSPSGGPRHVATLTWTETGPVPPTDPQPPTTPPTPSTVLLRTAVSAPSFPLDGVGTITVDVTNDGPDAAGPVQVVVRAPGLTLTGSPVGTDSDTVATLEGIPVGRRVSVQVTVTATTPGSFTGEVLLVVPTGVTDRGTGRVPFTISTYAVSGSVETAATTRAPTTSTTTRRRPRTSTTVTPTTAARPTPLPPTTRAAAPTTPPSTATPTTVAPTSTSAAATTTTATATTGSGGGGSGAGTTPSTTPPPFVRAERDPTPILEDDVPRRGDDGAYHFTYTVSLVNRSRDTTTRPKAVLHLPAGVALDGQAPQGCVADGLTRLTVTCTPDDAQHRALDDGELIGWRVPVHTSSTVGIEATLRAFDGSQAGKSEAEPTTFEAVGGDRLMPVPPVSSDGRGTHALAVVAALVAALMAGGVWWQGRRAPAHAGDAAPAGAFDAG